MNPAVDLRTRVNSRSFILVMSAPPSRTVPSSTLSSPEAQCSRVDFPDPEGPVTATNSPGPTSAVTQSKARTTSSPDRYVFDILSSTRGLVSYSFMEHLFQNTVFLRQANYFLTGQIDVRSSCHKPDSFYLHPGSRGW